MAARLIYTAGEWLPGISRYSATTEDIDGEGSTRNEAAVMHREVLRKDVKHIDVEHVCTTEDMRTVCRHIKEKEQIQMKVLCPADSSSDGDGYVSGTFYISKVQAEMIIYRNEPWWRITYSAVEI